jgi:hypothetical protein
LEFLAENTGLNPASTGGGAFSSSLRIAAVESEVRQGLPLDGHGKGVKDRISRATKPAYRRAITLSMALTNSSLLNGFSTSGAL